MDFNIIIPVYNAGPKINLTIDSLLAQTALAAGTARLTCLVVDGGSTDDTVARVRAYENPALSVISEPDEGMYDALAKGLARATGDVTGYMPAGETYDPHTFAVLTEVLARYPQIQWLTGQEVVRNADRQIVGCRVPHPFHQRFFDCGMYGTLLTVLQQESTLWRTDLNRHLDLDRLRTCRLAGDYFLWRSFARHHPLYVIDTHIGSFTVEPDQLSQQIPGAYRKELRVLRRRPFVWERILVLAYRSYVKCARVRKKARRMVCYSFVHNEWRLTRP